MKLLDRLLLIVLTLTLGAALSFGQSAGSGPVYSGATLPTSCTVGQVFFKTTAPIAIHGCYAANTWTANLGGGAFTHASPANQIANATATLKMNGLGAAGSPCTITPVISGRVQFLITGQQVQNTTADGVTLKLVHGTGTAPAAQAALTGTVDSAVQTWTALTGQLTSQFGIVGIATGLVVGTAVWYDLQMADVTGGSVTITNVDCTAMEL